MKHIFIVNPVAGKGFGVKLKKDIEKAVSDMKIQAVIYETKGIGDGKNFVKRICETKLADESIRFYSCGGDGTLNEVINGIIGFENVEAAAFPRGTGNDFVRNFHVAGFDSPTHQIEGKSVPTDVIKYRYKTAEGETFSGYGINMFNIGFDADVVAATNRYKRISFLKGYAAYFAGIIQNLIKMRGVDVEIICDDELAYKGKLLLAAFANGSYCGGGVKGVPTALVDDGYMDMSIIKRVPRRTFIKLFPRYKKGTHTDDESFLRIIDTARCKNAQITTNAEPFTVSIDGETVFATTMSFEIVPGKINFVIPKE